MKTLFKILILTVFTALFFWACKKEQPEILNAEDPCECANEVSADFKIEESSGTVLQYLTETDTVFKNKRVYFTAQEDDATYTWYIGIEEFTDQSVFRYFDDTWAGTNIPITLVVEKEPNAACFP